MYDKYTVGYNETLNDIADKFNTTKEELLSINNIPNILSTVNTTLLIHNNN